MVERSIDVARRVVRRAFLEVEGLPSRVVPSGPGSTVPLGPVPLQVEPSPVQVRAPVAMPDPVPHEASGIDNVHVGPIRLETAPPADNSGLSEALNSIPELGGYYPSAAD